MKAFNEHISYMLPKLTNTSYKAYKQEEELTYPSFKKINL